MLNNANELYNTYKEVRSRMGMAPKINFVQTEFVRPVNEKTGAIEFSKWHLRKLRQALDDALRNAETEPEIKVYRPKIKYIVALVAEEFGVTVSDLLSHRRPTHIATPRHMVVHLARRLTLRSTSEIGKVLGKRDHTTILNSIYRANELLDKDPILRERVERLEKLLKIEPEHVEG